MTNNPLLILIINMTVVFFVLFTLELLTRGIYLIDPTRKKKIGPVAKTEAGSQFGPQAERAGSTGDDLTIIAVIMAAIAAMGHTTGRISLIRRVDGVSWVKAGRIEAVNSRKGML